MYGCTSFQDYQTAKANPNAISVSNTGLSRFFQRYLLQKAMNVFKWKLPATWSTDYFLYTLYIMGFVAVVNTDAFGVIPQMCSLYGYDVFYRPTNATISNPVLRGILTPKIGEQCTIIKLQHDFGGIMDLVSFYADMMAISAQTAGVNIFNSKLSYVFGAKNKAAAESYKHMFDKLAQGDPAVVVDKTLFNSDGSPAWEMFSQNVGQNYIAGQILEDMRKWENMFDTAIGIPNANTTKKERMVVDEVNANNVETVATCAGWLEVLQDCCRKTNEMFGTNIAVDWRYKNVEGGVDNVGESKNNLHREQVNS